MNITNSPANEQNDEIDLLALIGTLLDYRWLILSITCIFTFLGITYAILATPIYQASALVQVEDRKAGIAGLDVMDDLFSGKSQSTTEIEILKSRMVIGKAVDNLHLDIIAEPAVFPIIGNRIVRAFKPTADTPVADSLLGLDAYNWGGAAITIEQFDVPDELLNQPLTLVAQGNNQFQLLFDDEVLLAGSVNELIAQQGVTLQVTALNAHNGQEFSLLKLNRLKAIKIYQDALQVSEAGKLSGMLNLSIQDADAKKAKCVLDEIASIYVKQNIERSSAEAANSLEFLRNQLPTVRHDMEKAESKLNEFQITSKSADISIETQSILNQLVKIDTEISGLNLKKLELDKLYTTAHPSYQTVQNQINSLVSNKQELEKKISNLPEVQQELLRLNRDVSVNSQIYVLLLQKSQELDIARASSVGNVRIIDAAAVDTSQTVAPKKALIVLISLILGAFLSIFAAIVHSLFNRGVEDAEEIEALDLSVFASIPFSNQQMDTRGKGKVKSNHLDLLSVKHPEDLAIEAFRSLHTSLHFTIPEAKNNILMISGPNPKVGKSFISSNLAVVIAQSGKKVLLIDADMRKGHLHRYFSVSNEYGLSNLLSAQTPLEQCLQHTYIDNLDFISRGKIPPNPSELLLAQRFTDTMQQLSQQYDLILIDTPPVLAVADALIVGKIAGSCFLAIRFGQNPIAEIKATIKRFETNGIELKGAILNAVRKKIGSYYKYGYYNYQYSYKSDKDKK